MIGFFVFQHHIPAMQDKFIRILELNDIKCCFLNPNEPNFWEQVGSCDKIILHFGQYRSQLEQASHFLPIFEKQLYKKCFPNVVSAWHFDDKIKQYYHLSLAGFPFAQCNIFYDKDNSLDYAKNADYPIVFKLRGGAGSSNVRLVNNFKEAQSYIDLMFGKGVYNSELSLGFYDDIAKHGFVQILKRKARKLKNILKNGYIKTQFWGVERDYILFQDFCPNNDHDTRVTVIGDRAFAFRRFNRKNDFRASGSGIIDWDPSKIDLRLIEIAMNISQTFGFQSMAYDFLYDKNKEPVLCEISYTFQADAVYKCPGFWDKSLKWHEGHLWPQYCILSDLLDEPNLKNID